ncbi:ABC transporter substrate-binding protein [Actinophytocola xanthii]|uniref:ABC transporter substrate-binding protein n=1 Tax=Actinophytocola xanthii TaxID=1912961 RepID=A0A1Q8CNF5_9PSEU|nr:ABC transporter substrate-binding protein [Actinophytocola xanthii]OLF15883.1 ABC transporter substrate-binding protein [Actinophytocola xanthii]
MVQIRPVRLVALGLTAALALSACAESERGGDDEGQSGGGQTGGTMTFATEGAPKLFDPFFATDGATFRTSQQIFEGLIEFKPGTADAEPGLAESWESSEDGKTWTFKLREGVKFHDGTDFNAEAACFNFDRWYNQTGAAQSPAVTGYWQDNFGGFADGKVPSLFESCSATDASTIEVKLTRSTSKFPDILGLPSWAMQSPKALQDYKADEVVQQGDSFVYPEYATEHPTGTGPFKFSKYDEANGTVELVRNEDYWGDKAKLDKLILRAIPDETARKQALQSGDIDGYDLPGPADWQGLKDDGYQLLIRPAFNIFYVGIGQKNVAKLRDLKVRQAIAHAIDREGLVQQQLPEGAKVAENFYPDTVSGWTDDVEKYDFDQDKAKQLLKEAGAENLTVNFYWPTEVTRPYMPNPQDMFGFIRGNLEAVGLKLNVVSKPWNGGYLEDVDQGKADLFLLGWNGDYNTPDNFIGNFFSDPNNRFGTGNSPWGQTLSDELKAADTEPDPETRKGMYEDLNKKLKAEYLPAIPISHSPPALVVAENVEGLVPSPLTDERFDSVSIG